MNESFSETFVSQYQKRKENALSVTANEAKRKKEIEEYQKILIPIRCNNSLALLLKFNA